MSCLQIPHSKSNVNSDVNHKQIKVYYKVMIIPWTMRPISHIYSDCQFIDEQRNPKYLYISYQTIWGKNGKSLYIYLVAATQVNFSDTLKE